MSKYFYDLTIFIPAFNEENYIIPTIKKIYSSNIEKKKIEIIIIDDYSSDETSKLVKLFIKSNKNKDIILIKNNKNLGVASNFKKALKISKGKYFRMVCGDDIDYILTHKLVFKYLEHFDIINPFYKIVRGKSLKRKIISKLFTTIVNFISGNRLNYYNGTVAYKSEKLKKLNYICDGFGFQAHITCQLLKDGSTIKEIPCNALHREKSSAINIKNFYLAFIIFLKLFLLKFSNKNLS